MDKCLLQFCSEIELVPTDIMPMIHYTWLLSFADIPGNKQAIIEHNLNPLNKNLLLLNMLQRTMTDYDRDEERREYITPEKLELFARQHSEQLHAAEASTESVANSHLNFNHAYSSMFIDKLVGHSDIEKARACNKYHATCGTNTEELSKQVKKLTSAGELV